MTQNKFKVLNVSIVDQIQASLKDERRLIQRTQVRRSGKVCKWTDRINEAKKENEKVLYSFRSPHKTSFSIFPLFFPLSSFPLNLNSLSQQKLDENIYDDVDFYSQLLKELTDSSLDSSDPLSMSKAWLNSREGIVKLRKNVDRKASKSRRLKYTVHEKLVNFMAPREDGVYPPDGLVESLFR